MNAPLKPGQTALPAATTPGPAPADDLHHGVHLGQWSPVVEEAPQTTELYARRGGARWEVIADAGGLTVTEIVPTMASVGMSAALPAKVYGTGFTATTVVHWDGAPLATTFDPAKPSELGITIDTTMGVAPSVATVTVVDGATIGTGAAGFHFVSPGGQYHFVIGLTHDDTTDDVNLTPAGDGPPTLGGVYVIDRERNNTEGLELGIDGRLRAPLATDSLAGTILEPPPDDKGYVRRRTAAGQSAWVPPADAASTHYGIGLSFDDATRVVDLQPAGHGDPKFLGGIYEPPLDGLAYSRQYNATTNTWEWVPALTAGLQITGLIPNKAVIGEPIMTVHAYGAEFTPTCVVVVDGTDASSTTYISPTEMTFPMNPAVPSGPSVHIITVRDTAAVPPPGTGLGAEQFEFIVATTTVDYGTGLSFDTTTDPPIVNLQPAQDAANAIGGVYVVDRERNVSEGLELGIDGRLRAPLATPRLAGTIVEPEDDGKGYVRTTLNGVSMWVPPATAAETHYALGLSHDDVTGDVNLTPAGWAPELLGGVYGSARSATQGLDLAAAGTGEISVPLATDLLAGSIVEPPPDGQKYVRERLSTGVSQWVHAAAHMDYRIGLHEWFDPAGERMNVVDLKPASPSEIGGIKEPPLSPIGVTYTRSNEGEWVPLPPAGVPVDYGTGLSLDETASPQIVHLQPAGLTPALLGGVWVPPRGALQGLEINTQQPGMLIAPPATDQLAGVIVEPPVGPGQLWARTTSAPGTGKWEPVSNIGTLTYKGAWKPATNDPNIHAVPTKVNGDFWIVDCVDPLVAETPPIGSTPGLDSVMLKEGDWVIWNEAAQLWNHIQRTEALTYTIGLIDQRPLGINNINLKPATDIEIGGLYEAPNDGVAYVRQFKQWEKLPVSQLRFRIGLTEAGGVVDLNVATETGLGGITEPPPDRGFYARTNDGARASWAPFDPGSTNYIFGTGLDRTGNRIDLQIAGTAQQIGGVKLIGRGPTNGLEFDLATGLVTAPLATDVVAGSIIEPPPDDLQYVRTRTAAGVSSWVASTAIGVEYGLGLTLDPATTPSPTVNLDPAGDVPAELGGVWVPERNENQGLQLTDGGRLIVPKATDLLAGAITEPPADDRQYARVRSTTTGQSLWTAVMAAGVIIADAPPDVAMTPPGTLWWESDTGTLYILYEDVDSRAWVEAVAGADPGVKTHISDTAPVTAAVGDLWWDSDAGTLAIYFQDVDSTAWVQVAGPQPPPPAGGVEEAPIDNTPYSRQDGAWVSSAAALATFTTGDLKHGFQTADHAGWIKLDGRAVSTLTATQQAEAATLGFTANLPLGDGAVFMQSAAALGSVSGGTLTQAMLPAVDLTAASGGASTPTTGSTANLSGRVNFDYPGGGSGRLDYAIPGSDAGAHTHTVSIPAHTHTVPLGGTGETIVPKNVSANAFIFLGV